MTSRHAHLDMARGGACFLAIFAHAANGQNGIMDDMPMEALFLLTRSATPAFMVLFGAMLAIVYFRTGPKARSPGEMRARFLSRAITCYLIYACIAAAAFATGKIPADKLFDAITFASSGRFGEILKIYAAVFVLLIALAPLIARHRLRALVGIAAAAWAVKLALAAALDERLYPLHFLTGYDRGFGPAILLSFTFVAFGFAAGEAVQGLRRRRVLIAPLAVSAAIMAYGAVQYGGLEAVAREVGSFRLRSVNSPIYYAYGILMSMGWLALCKALADWGGLPWLRRVLTVVGMQSLYFYGMGNILLNLLPVNQGWGFAAGLVLTLAFLAVLTWLTMDKAAGEASVVRRVTGGVFKRLGDLYGGAVTRVAQALAGARPPA